MSLDSMVSKEKTTTGQWTMEKIKTSYAHVLPGDGCLAGKYKTEMTSQ